MNATTPITAPRRINKDELERYLWGAATFLRGLIDAGDYKQFIFPLLFFKRISDVYDEEFARAMKDSGGDVDYAAIAENHRFQIPEGAHWRDVLETSANLGKAIQRAMRDIETANPDLLYGIFGDAQWTNKERLSDATLRDLLDHYNSVTLTLANVPEDELGGAYEFLIKKFADDSGHTAAEFYTNRTVVHLMTAMLEPQEGESIYDPTCGSGGMLLSCAVEVKRRGQEWRNLRLYGQERNLLTSAIARMNLFLHGFDDFHIVRGDTLADPKFLEGDRLRQFDLILANPPYSIKQWDRARWGSDPYGRNAYGTPPQGRADYAFWQHILASLKPDTGRCAILFPHGVLFRDEERKMREEIVKADVIECVLGLGPNLFYNSPMEACVVICRARKSAERRGRVLFIDAKKEVARERALSFLTEGHIGKIVGAYREFADEEGFARVADLDEIAANGYNLNLPLYVRNGTNGGGAETPPLEEVIEDWGAGSLALRETMRDLFAVLDAKPPVVLLSGAEADDETDAEPPCLPRLGGDRSEWGRVTFGEVASCTNKSERNPLEKGMTRYVGLEHIDPEDLRINRWGDVADGTSFTRVFRKGQVLFGKRRAYQRKVAVADFDGICSGDILVFEACLDVLLPDLLPFIAQSEGFFQHALGTSAGSMSPRTKWSEMAMYEFALPPMDEQRRIAELLWAVEGARLENTDVEKRIDEVRRTLLNDFFPAKLDEKVVLSAGWSWQKVSEVGEVQLGRQRSPAYTRNINPRPYLRVANVFDGYFELSDVLEMDFGDRDFQTYSLRSGDVLLNEGQSRELVGRSAIYHGEIEGCCFQNTLIRFRAGSHVLPQFAQAFFQWAFYRGEFARIARQTTSIAHLGADRFGNLPMPLPPLDEQRHFIDRLLNVEHAQQQARLHASDVKSLREAVLEFSFGRK